MVVYEITAQVLAELCQEFEKFMQLMHIPDVLATGSFVSASFARSVPGRYRICYMASNREALDEYLKTHAPRLRNDFLERYSAGVDLSREEWELISTYSADSAI